MQEIRFHGRGGQGAVVGSEVLAHAFFLEGRHVQAFPQFGVERRGAPVTAFCRVDDRPILLRCQIYRPDHVIVLDASLIQTAPLTHGLAPGGTLVLNGRREPRTYAARLGQGFRIHVVDAATVAVEHGLGTPSNPIVNTAILGAFAGATRLLSLEAVARAIEECVPSRTRGNVAAARAAYDRVVSG
ncbi:MAG: 2-oxoacid:acceptor oxidoreductase family protein [bacterium]